jgi:hypothetical protein
LPFIAVGLTALSAGRTALAVKTVDGSFAKGGFTGPGKFQDDTGHRVAGYVHDGEYVIPKWQVSNPKYSQFINWVENDRMRGYAQGGYVNTTPTIEAVTYSNTSMMSIEMIERFESAVERLSNAELKAKMVYSDFEKIDSDVKNTRSAASY